MLLQEEVKCSEAYEEHGVDRRELHVKVEDIKQTVEHYKKEIHYVAGSRFLRKARQDICAAAHYRDEETSADPAKKIAYPVKSVVAHQLLAEVVEDLNLEVYPDAYDEYHCDGDHGCDHKTSGGDHTLCVLIAGEDSFILQPFIDLMKYDQQHSPDKELEDSEQKTAYGAVMHRAQLICDRSQDDRNDTYHHECKYVVYSALNESIFICD